MEKNEADLSKVLDVYFYAHKRGTATEEIYRTLNESAVNDTTEQDIFFNVVSIWRRRHAPTSLVFSPVCADAMSMSAPACNGVGVFLGGGVIDRFPGAQAIA